MTRGVTPRRRAVAATDSPRATSRTARARRNRRASWAARSCRWSRRRCQAVRVKVSITASLYGKGTRNALSAKRLLRTCLDTLSDEIIAQALSEGRLSEDEAYERILLASAT